MSNGLELCKLKFQDNLKHISALHRKKYDSPKCPCKFMNLATNYDTLRLNLGLN